MTELDHDVKEMRAKAMCISPSDYCPGCGEAGIDAPKELNDFNAIRKIDPEMEDASACKCSLITICRTTFAYCYYQTEMARYRPLVHFNCMKCKLGFRLGIPICPVNRDEAAKIRGGEPLCRILWRKQEAST